VSPDAFVELVWTFDLIAKTTTLWWGDDQMETLALADGGTMIATTTRNIVLLANALGADVRYIECWKAAPATRDTTALGAAHKRIAAGADANPVQIPPLPSW